MTCQLTPDEDGGSVRRRGGWGLQESRQSGGGVPVDVSLLVVRCSSAAWIEGKNNRNST